MMKNFILGAPSVLQDYYLDNTDKLFSKVGNTGNFAFRYAIKKHVEGSVKELPWSSSVEAIKNAGNVGVLPCANMLGEHIDLGSRAIKMKQTNSSFLAIGLGAQSDSLESIPKLPRGTLEWLDLLSIRSNGKKNILVRGEYTKKVLKYYGYSDNVEVLGCPSLFINPNPRLGEEIYNRMASGVKRIGVAAGNPAQKKFWSVERCLYNLSYSNFGCYFVQAPLPFLKFSRGEVKEVNESWISNIKNAMGLDLNEERYVDVPANVVSFYDVRAWMECLRRHDFVVGARIHGVMLAIQSGIPAMCVAHDTRTREMCEFMHIPYVSVDNLSDVNFYKKEILDFYKFDHKKFDENRVLLAKKYKKILLDNNVSLSRHLDKMV